MLLGKFGKHFFLYLCSIMNKEYFNKYYKDGQYFKYSNPNPAAAERHTLKWDRGDCAIRAVAHALNITWLRAFDLLTSYARSKYNVLNDRGLTRAFFTEYGYTYVGLKPERGKHRMTVEEFAKTHKKGYYFISIANHFTACVNGKIYDVWNCGDSAVNGYVEIDKTFKEHV